MAEQTTQQTTQQTTPRDQPTVGIIMNGVSGRMGYRQHLVRSILAIREQGGVLLADGVTRVQVEPILVGRSEAKLAELTPEMLIRAAWEREHSTELHRLNALDRQITWNEGTERVVSCGLERGPELGRGMGHGIEL